MSEKDQEIFFGFLKNNPSNNISFQEMSQDEGLVGSPTRYGRSLLGKFVCIDARVGGVVIVLSCVKLTQEVYDRFKEVGCKTND